MKLSAGLTRGFSVFCGFQRGAAKATTRQRRIWRRANPNAAAAMRQEDEVRAVPRQDEASKLVLRQGLAWLAVGHNAALQGGMAVVPQQATRCMLKWLAVIVSFEEAIDPGD